MAKSFQFVLTLAKSTLVDGMVRFPRNFPYGPHGGVHKHPSRGSDSHVFRQAVRTWHDMKGGVYVLFVGLRQARRMRVGRLGKIDFEKGLYFYVGSASRSIEKRVRRHVTRGEVFHWHIDYFLRHGEPIAAFCISTSEPDAECRMAKALSERFKSIPDFGCSDCRCRSHLFYQTFEGGSDEEVP